jgi:hypothetical protein
MGCDHSIGNGNMKVRIGPYTSDLIPVRGWERQYEYWRKPDTLYLDEKDYTWYDKIVMGLFDKLYSVVLPINRWSNSRKRKIIIHIDYHDVWSADHTLALIIHPVLIELRKHKHGSPCVDDQDVPENLRANKKDHDDMSEEDSTIHERWEYVLGEMIWAFEQHTYEDCNDEQFHHNSDQLHMIFKDADGKQGFKMDYQKDPAKPPYYVDQEGKTAHYERIANGRRLFAKYYEALWD